jgi:hypothetical protein
LGVPGKGQLPIALGIDLWGTGGKRLGDVHRDKVESPGSEGVGEMHPQRLASYGQVKDLPHGDVAQIVSRQCILRLRDLLRGTPTGYPRAFRGDGLRRSLSPRGAGHPTNDRQEYQCFFHRGGRSMGA